MDPAEFLQRALRYLLAPFDSPETFLSALAGPFHALFDPASKTAWPYLGSSLLIAWVLCVVARRRGHIPPDMSFRSFLLPREVVLHPSAIVDYKFVLVDLTIRFILYAPIIAGVSQLAYRTIAPLVLRFSVELPIEAKGVRIIVLTIVGILIADLGLYVGHWLLHRVPFLWRFHEVHHSAEVLTPATVYRVHPVEDLIFGLAGAVIAALGASVYAAASGADVRPLSLFGVNIVLMAFFIVGFQLRHSHIWLSYGPFLSRIFISPAQHQIHHSRAAHHWDKNYGFTFAIWDLLFGTLYVPRKREQITFGIPGSDPAEYDSVWKLYWRPFRRAYDTLRRPHTKGKRP
jgi:sterol desaturase/sphingolipid hydroxylase (fatty acid hydroxylase superfamily)